MKLKPESPQSTARSPNSRPLQALRGGRKSAGDSGSGEPVSTWLIGQMECEQLLSALADMQPNARHRAPGPRGETVLDANQFASFFGLNFTQPNVPLK